MKPRGSLRLTGPSSQSRVKVAKQWPASAARPDYVSLGCIALCSERTNASETRTTVRNASSSQPGHLRGSGGFPGGRATAENGIISRQLCLTVYFLNVYKNHLFNRAVYNYGHARIISPLGSLYRVSDNSM